jgi:hypothetical protein
MAGGQVQTLGSFGDTASHLPDCCSLHALVSDAEGPYLNRPFLSGSPFPIPTFRPAKLVTWQPVIPNGSYPLHCLGQIATPQRCVLERPLGTQIVLGWGRQNERDRAMVKDPPTDLEEVVGGT